MDATGMESTCARAAASGRLDVLQYARENGCPWDEETVQKAIFGGHRAVAVWAIENGCPAHAYYRQNYRQIIEDINAVAPI